MNDTYNYKIHHPSRQFSPGTRIQMNSLELQNFIKRIDAAKTSKEKNAIKKEYHDLKMELKKRDPNYKLPEIYSLRNPSAAETIARGNQNRKLSRKKGGKKGGKRTRKNKSRKNKK